MEIIEKSNKIIWNQIWIFHFYHCYYENFDLRVRFLINNIISFYKYYEANDYEYFRDNITFDELQVFDELIMEFEIKNSKYKKMFKT